MLTYFDFQVRTSGTNTGVTGLSFGYTFPAPYITVLARKPSGALTPNAGNSVITELGYGWYTYAFDADAQGADCYALLDCGATLSNADRYLYLSLPRTQSRILGTLPTTGQVTVGAYSTGANPLVLLSSSQVPLLTDSNGRVSVSSNLDKTGYGLATTGLDAVSTTDVASVTDAKSTLPKLVRSLWDRQYNQVTQTATQQQVYTDAVTVFATMAVGDNGTTSTKGAAT